MSTYIIIPTYNEAGNIVKLIEAIMTSCPHANVLVVDDASPDGTAEVVERMSNAHSQIHVLRRAGKLGFASAVVEGIRFALEQDAERVIAMDADFSHPPSAIPAMLAASERFDLVIGSRYVAGGGTVNRPWPRRLVSWVGNSCGRTLLGLPVLDCTSGFRCWRTEALERVRLEDIAVNGYCFQVVNTYRAHRHQLLIREVPIVFTERRLGESKFTAATFSEAVIIGLQLFMARLGIRLANCLVHNRSCVASSVPEAVKTRE